MYGFIGNCSVSQIDLYGLEEIPYNFATTHWTITPTTSVFAIKTDSECWIGMIAGGYSHDTKIVRHYKIGDIVGGALYDASSYEAVMSHEEKHREIFYYFIQKVIIEKFSPWRDSYKTCTHTSMDEALEEARNDLMYVETQIGEVYRNIHNNVAQNGSGHPLAVEIANGHWVAMGEDDQWLQKAKKAIDTIHIDIPVKNCK